MRIYKFLSRFSFVLLAASVFLIQLPPFDPVFTRNQLFNSHSIARYFMLILLAKLAWDVYRGKRLALRGSFVLVLFAFFLSQSLSIIDAVNLHEFLRRYKTVAFGIIAFFVGINELDTKDRVIAMLRVLAVTVIANMLTEAVIYYQVPFVFSAFKFLVNEQYLTDLELNMFRERYFIDIYDAALIPLLMYLFLHSKRTSARVILFAAPLMVAVCSLLSNFRAQFLISIVSTFTTSVLLMRKYRRTIFFIVLLAVIFFVVHGLMIRSTGYDSLDRLIAPESEDFGTIHDRMYYWKESLEIGSAYPVFGVGLGNFFEHIVGKIVIRDSLFYPKNDLFKITWIHPHNVFFGLFAETGFLGLAAFLLLLSRFLREDADVIFGPSLSGKAIVISFWSLFLFSLVNPATTLDYTVLFWILRAMLHGHTNRKTLPA